MALKITGDVLINDLKYPNPQINLVPHLEIFGAISMDAHVLINGSHKTTIPYYNINRNLLAYPADVYDAYNSLIMALEEYVKDDLLSKDPELIIESWSPSVITEELNNE